MVFGLKILDRPTPCHARRGRRRRKDARFKRVALADLSRPGVVGPAAVAVLHNGGPTSRPARRALRQMPFSRLDPIDRLGGRASNNKRVAVRQLASKLRPRPRP